MLKSLRLYLAQLSMSTVFCVQVLACMESATSGQLATSRCLYALPGRLGRWEFLGDTRLRIVLARRLRQLESQNDHSTSKHRQIPGMGLFFTLLRRLSMTAWVLCKALLNIQRTRWRIRRDRAQGSNALDSRKHIHPHLSGSTLDRKVCSRNQRTFQDPYSVTLQVYLPFFVIDDFITSQRLEAAMLVHALEVLAGLPHALHVWVLERFHDTGPNHYSDNGEEDGATYGVFVTVTH